MGSWSQNVEHIWTHRRYYYIKFSYLILATVIATSADCDASAPLVTIGRPIPHYLSYIADPVTHQLVPRGVPGELLIGGPGLARGYVKRPELTDSVFIKNPFQRNQADPDRLYRTGDLCRWSEHGEIEFMGRIDAQVCSRPINGFLLAGKVARFSHRISRN